MKKANHFYWLVMLGVILAGTTVLMMHEPTLLEFMQGWVLMVIVMIVVSFLFKGVLAQSILETKIKEWAEQHGSRNLQVALEEGYPCKYLLTKECAQAWVNDSLSKRAGDMRMRLHIDRHSEGAPSVKDSPSERALEVSREAWGALPLLLGESPVPGLSHMPPSGADESLRPFLLYPIPDMSIVAVHPFWEEGASGCSSREKSYEAVRIRNLLPGALDIYLVISD